MEKQIRKPMKIHAFLGIIILLVASCKHDPFGVPPTGGGNGNNGSGSTNSDVCSDDTTYFRNDVMPIITSNCAYSGCHGDGSAEDGVDLSSYEKIILTGEVVPGNPGGSEIYEVITETDPDKRMPPPPNAPLTSEQIQTIRDWIAQGALNNGCTECDTTDVTFSSNIQPFIEQYCRGCHSGNSPSGGVSLTTYAEIKSVADMGALLGTIDHQDGYVPMPYNQPKLDQCKIDMVRIWIEMGAPEN
ncbi:MAG: hypothetical protein Kow0075_14220 [Salibacteraceae bacterium]